MNLGRQHWSYLCAKCARSKPPKAAKVYRYGRALTTSITLPQQVGAPADHDAGEDGLEVAENEATSPQGRMSARLARMTEESIEQGGQSAKKTVEEAGFSEDLKRQLEARIQQSAFKSENAVAFAQTNMPVRLSTRIIRLLTDMH